MAEAKGKSEDSVRIDLLKFVCAVLVVAIHSPFMWNTTSLAVGGSGSASFTSFGLTRIAVPFFFVFSGFFLARHLDTAGDWLKAVRRRVRTILVPFFIWTIIGILLLPVAIAILSDLFSGRPFGLSALQFLKGYDWTYPLEKLFYKSPIVPLWYLRCLFIFVLLAPAIARLTRRFGRGWLALSFALGVLCHLVPGRVAFMLLNFNFSLPGLFYFSCGIYLGAHTPSVLRSGNGGWLAGALGAALLVGRAILAANGCGVGAAMLQEAAIPFLLFAAWRLTPAVRLPGWLEGMSFPIYLMHMCAFSCLSPVLRLSGLAESPNVCAVIRLVVGVFGPVAVAHGLRRISPGLAGVLFGER